MSDEQKKPESPIPPIGVIWKWLQVIAAGVAAVAVGVVHLEAKAQDAGVQAAAPALLEAHAASAQLERKEREDSLRFERVEQQLNSTEHKVDELQLQLAELKLQMAALLERFKIPNPAPPADAGRESR